MTGMKGADVKKLKQDLENQRNNWRNLALDLARNFAKELGSTELFAYIGYRVAKGFLSDIEMIDALQEIAGELKKIEEFDCHTCIHQDDSDTTETCETCIDYSRWDFYE